MKVFTVIYEFGEYDEYGWKLKGTFSSRELAQEFIDTICAKVDPESKRQEWEDFCAKERKRIFEDTVRFHAEEVALLKSLEETRENLKDKIPDFNKGNIRRTKNAIEMYAQSIAKGEGAIYTLNLEAYMYKFHHRPDASRMSIIESELDNPVKGCGGGTAFPW